MPSFKFILFNIEKSDNIGMLMRSAYAFGCEEVVIIGRPKFKNTGAQGAQQFQKKKHFFTLDQGLAYCRREGCEIVGLEIGGEPLHETRFNRDAAFLLGNEGRGMGDTKALCDRILTIPQWGGIPSLNVAVAGSIAMYSFQIAQAAKPAQVSGDRFVDANFEPPA